MTVIFLLIGFSLFVALSFLIAFIWAQKSGQYDDVESHGVRMLIDTPLEKKPKIQSNTPLTNPLIHGNTNPRSGETRTES